MGNEPWKDRLARWIADRLPKKVVYFAILRAWSWDVWTVPGETRTMENALADLAVALVRYWEKHIYREEVTNDRDR